MNDKCAENIVAQITAEIDRQKDIESTLLAVRYYDALEALAHGVNRDSPEKDRVLGWVRKKRESLIQAIAIKQDL